LIINHKVDYQRARAAEYPSVEDQLDALWHAMDNESIPKAEPFYSNLKSVKDKYPKPSK
jgi:hypothetical protein